MAQRITLAKNNTGDIGAKIPGLAQMKGHADMYMSNILIAINAKDGTYTQNMKTNLYTLPLMLPRAVPRTPRSLPDMPLCLVHA